MPSCIQSCATLTGEHLSGVITILVSALHISGFILIIHALFRKHSPQGTIAWVLGMALLPGITVPLYLILGAARIRRHTSMRKGRENIQKFLRQHGAWNPPQGTLEKTLCNCTGYAPCSGNKVSILKDGNNTYLDLLRAISNARQSILVEFFIIRNDRVGNTLREALEERARAGVQVCIIYDEVGSHKLPAGYLRSLKRAGVQVASFNGRRFWLSSILRINYRNHRKLVIIDNSLAYLGSLNIGLEYTRSPHRPYWRDTFVSLRGPIVTQCQLSFLDDWQRATGTTPDTPETSGSAPAQQPEKQQCQLVPSGPDDHPMNTWQLLLLQLASLAQQRLWLASPYFVPSEAVKEALCAAAMRGVDVRILIPERGDNRAAELAMLTFIPDMLSCGVHMLAYTPGFLHEKVCIMDSSTCSIGTANLDERSLRLNFELTLLMEDTASTAGVSAMLEQDMSASLAITPARWYKAPWMIRLLANCCRLLSPAL